MNREWFFKKASQWGPVLLLMIAIFLFSSIPAEQVSSVSDSIIQTAEAHSEVVKSIDLDWLKIGHVIGYGLLGLALYRGFLISGQDRIIAPVLISMIYACSDEFHQLFVSQRSSSAWDVLLDTCAALVFILILRALRRRA